MGRFGVREYGPSGDTDEILKEVHLDVESVTDAIWDMMR
jgi:transketolase